MSEPIFVFGSNLAGRHGKGAAQWARQHRGAIYGQGVGLQGRSYAIPTKDAGLKTLPLPDIERFVGEFLRFATSVSHETFQLTPVGCGLAGLKPSQIAPMFRHAPPNVILPDEFKAILADVAPSGAALQERPGSSQEEPLPPSDQIQRDPS